MNMKNSKVIATIILTAMIASATLSSCGQSQNSTSTSSTTAVTDVDVTSSDVSEQTVAPDTHESVEDTVASLVAAINEQKVGTRTFESMANATEAALNIPDYTEEEKAAFESGNTELLVNSEHCKQFMTKALAYFATFDDLDDALFTSLFTNKEACMMGHNHQYGSYITNTFIFMFTEGDKCFTTRIVFNAWGEMYSSHIDDDEDLEYIDKYYTQFITQLSSINPDSFNFIHKEAYRGYPICGFDVEEEIIFSDITTVPVLYTDITTNINFKNFLMNSADFLGCGEAYHDWRSFGINTQIGSLLLSVMPYNWGMDIQLFRNEPYWEAPDASKLGINFICKSGNIIKCSTLPEEVAEPLKYDEGVRLEDCFDRCSLSTYFNVPASELVVDIEVTFDGEVQCNLGEKATKQVINGGYNNYFDIVAPHPEALNNCTDEYLRELVKNEYSSFLNSTDYNESFTAAPFRILKYHTNNWLNALTFFVTNTPNYEDLATDTLYTDVVDSAEVWSAMVDAVNAKLSSDSYSVAFNDLDNYLSLLFAKNNENVLQLCTSGNEGDTECIVRYFTNGIRTFELMGEKQYNSFEELFYNSYINVRLPLRGDAEDRYEPSSVGCLANDDYYFLTVKQGLPVVISRSDNLPVLFGGYSIDWEDTTKLQYTATDDSVQFTGSEVLANLSAIVQCFSE